MARSCLKGMTNHKTSLCKSVWISLNQLEKSLYSNWNHPVPYGSTDSFRYFRWHPVALLWSGTRHHDHLPSAPSAPSASRWTKVNRCPRCVDKIWQIRTRREYEESERMRWEQLRTDIHALTFPTCATSYAALCVWNEMKNAQWNQ